MEDMPEHLRGKGGIPYGKAGVLRSLVLILLAVSLVIGGYLWAEKEVTIYVDGETVVKKTLQRDVGGLLQEAGIKLGPQDLTEPEPSVLLTSGMEVTVRRAVPFTVVVDGEKKNLLSAQATVGLALEEAGIDLSRHDRTEPDFTSPVVPGMEIEVIRVEKELVTAQASIPYQVLRRNDSNMLTGQAKVIKEGKEGLVERILQIIYENGVKVKEILINEQVLQAPVTQIVAVGTVDTIARGGETLRFKEMRVMEATAYSPDPRSTGIYADGMTATGIKAQRGVVAVDPKVIPLGTRLYIEGYGKAVAADTGGAIKGNIVDLCFNTHEEAVRFGRRRVQVYILH